MRLLFSSSLLLLLLAGCVSQRPVLYPNEQLRRVGSTIADRDVEQCMQQAEYYVSAESRAGKALEGVAAESVSSAAVGAAAGAAGGAVVGRPGSGGAPSGWRDARAIRRQAPNGSRAAR